MGHVNGLFVAWDNITVSKNTIKNLKGPTVNGINVHSGLDYGYITLTENTISGLKSNFAATGIYLKLQRGSNIEIADNTIEYLECDPVISIGAFGIYVSNGFQINIVNNYINENKGG